MFLQLLSEEVKKDFLGLCIYAINADGIITEEETDTMDVYCREMNIPQDAAAAESGLENILDDVKEHATERDKKIIVFELLGLVNADNDFAKEEEEFMIHVIETLEINRADMKLMTSLLEIYKAVYKEICMAVVI